MGRIPSLFLATFCPLLCLDLASPPGSLLQEGLGKFFAHEVTSAGNLTTDSQKPSMLVTTVRNPSRPNCRVQEQAGQKPRILTVFHEPPSHPGQAMARRDQEISTERLFTMFSYTDAMEAFELVLQGHSTDDI
jgi:hypothetical protein